MVPVATTLKSICKIITLVTQTHPSVSSFALPIIIYQYIWSSRLVGPVYSRAVSHCCNIQKNIKKRQRMSLIIPKKWNSCCWNPCTSWICVCNPQRSHVFSYSSDVVIMLSPELRCWNVTHCFASCWINFDMCSMEEDFQKPLLFISAKETSSPWRKVSLFLSCQREKKKAQTLKIQRCVAVAVGSCFSPPSWFALGEVWLCSDNNLTVLSREESRQNCWIYQPV